MTRGQVGHELALIEITVAVAAVVSTGLIWVLAPHSTRPINGGFRPWETEAILVVAFLGLVVGFAWMIRIYRSNPEPDPHVWRYRDRA